MISLKGQIINLEVESRKFEVIVIDPNGIGKNQPSVGFGFGMMDKNGGVPQSTLSTWYDKNKNKVVLPSGKEIQVFDVTGLDGNNYKIIEASDWFDLAFDLLENPGQTGKKLKTKLLSFVKWFTIKGFYAEAYVVLKGVYTSQDSRTLSIWMEARIAGKYKRKLYTDFLQSQGAQSFDYGNWTNHVYLGLFDKTASEMKKEWEIVQGNKQITRNYIPEALGLEAVAYCENMAVQLFVKDLTQAHNDAIKYTKAKFFGKSLDS